MTRAELHQLIDELPEESVPAATAAVERALRDPVAAILDAAPPDNEPLASEELAAVEDAKREADVDGWVTFEELKAELNRSES
ncbi:MAG: hypothetical protein ACREQM_18395 [Candidatus Dormibacteraceae bacterium]